MTPDQRLVAQCLADARIEALEERPSSCAALNSVVHRLAEAWSAHDPGFDRDGFCQAADYYGQRTGTEQLGMLPGRRGFWGRQPGQVPPGHPDAAHPAGWGEHPRDCNCGDCP
jgi:hypothetical protein